MAHIRTVVLKRNDETITVDILRCDDGTRYAAWPAVPNANCKWIGNSFRELSIKWGREGWVAVVGPDQQETLNVAEVELAASQLLEFEDTRKGRRVTLLNLMRDVANLKSLVDLLSLRVEKDHEKCLKGGKFRGIGQQEIEERPQKIASDSALIELFDEYEKTFLNRKEVPVASEPELLQLVLIGRIWKKLNGYQPPYLTYYCLKCKRQYKAIATPPESIPPKCPYCYPT